MRKDAVTPELRQDVFARDRMEIEETLMPGGPQWPYSIEWQDDRLLMNGGVVCVAVLIDRMQLGECSGRWTIEHVKDQARFGVRAASDLSHCISLCEGHTENGMKAGYQWNTAHRPELREYLAGVA